MHHGNPVAIAQPGLSSLPALFYKLDGLYTRSHGHFTEFASTDEAPEDTLILLRHQTSRDTEWPD